MKRGRSIVTVETFCLTIVSRPTKIASSQEVYLGFRLLQEVGPSGTGDAGRCNTVGIKDPCGKFLTLPLRVYTFCKKGG